MATNSERSSANGGGAYRSLRSPPPPFRPPPPLAPPPLAPASPMTRRKLSVNAPFEQANANAVAGSPGPSPSPPKTGFPPKRPVEKVVIIFLLLGKLTDDVISYLLEI